MSRNQTEKSWYGYSMNGLTSYSLTQSNFTFQDRSHCKESTTKLSLTVIYIKK